MRAYCLYYSSVFFSVSTWIVIAFTFRCVLAATSLRYVVCVHNDCGVPKSRHGRCDRTPHRMREPLHNGAPWVSSSRIPLLFVSLASTVDHHNRLCIVFGIVFLPDSRVLLFRPRAIFYYRSMWNLYFFRSVFSFIHSNFGSYIFTRKKNKNRMFLYIKNIKR